MRRTKLFRSLILGLTGATACALGACSSYHGSGPRYGEFASNPTPHTESLAYWKVERHNQHRYTEDNNGRAFWDDIDRFILRDRPSRLIMPPSAN